MIHHNYRKLHGNEFIYIYIALWIILSTLNLIIDYKDRYMYICIYTNYIFLLVRHDAKNK